MKSCTRLFGSVHCLCELHSSSPSVEPCSSPCIITCYQLNNEAKSPLTKTCQVSKCSIIPTKMASNSTLLFIYLFFVSKLRLSDICFIGPNLTCHLFSKSSLLKHSHACSCLCCLWLICDNCRAELLQQTVQLIRAKIFTIWLSTENICWPFI